MEKKKQEEYDFLKEEIKKKPMINMHRSARFYGRIFAAVLLVILAVLIFFAVRPIWKEHVAARKQASEIKAAYLGIEVCTVTGEMKKKYHLPQGVYVRSVNLDSPALAAGLHRGDVIHKMNGTVLERQEQYETFLASCRNGQTLAIELQRLGPSGTYQKVDCKATLSISKQEKLR